VDLSVLLVKGFLGWKYLEMMLISFLDLAGRGGRGGALLIVTGVDLGVSFLELPLGVTCFFIIQEIKEIEKKIKLKNKLK